MGGYFDIFHNEEQTIVTRNQVPQGFEANFQATIRELGQEEAGRIFTADQPFSLGPRETSAPFLLPELPYVLPFNVGGVPMEYKIRVAPTAEEFTFPDHQGDEVVLISSFWFSIYHDLVLTERFFQLLQIQVDDLPRLYDRATYYWSFLCFTNLNPVAHDRPYRQMLQYKEGLSSTGFKGGERSFSFIGKVHEVPAPAPVPYPPAIPRCSYSCLSPLSRNDGVGSSVKRDR